MDVRRLTGDLAVTGQIHPDDIGELAAEGYRAIICNRPDGEAPDQPTFRNIEQIAAAQGIKIIYQPVMSGAIAEDDVLAFEKALANLPKPVVAYCRSGTRCTALWSLSEAGKRPVEEILSLARNAGYDMTPLLPKLMK